MEKYIYDNSTGLWYELHGDYYLPCLVIPEEEIHTIGITALFRFCGLFPLERQTLIPRDNMH